MLKFFRKLFKRKQPKKVIEVYEEAQVSVRKRHDFVSFTDSRYCKILERTGNSSENSGTLELRIAWRSSSPVNIGDIIVLSDGMGLKTLRLVKVLSDDKSDVKLGIATCFK
jgi:hypothetical protein